MFDLVVSLAIFFFLCGCALLGRWLLRFLPERHRSEETMEFTRVASGLLVTFTALVLSLLITNIDAQFAKTESDLRNYGSMITRISSELGDLPVAATSMQFLLRQYTASAIASTWPREVAPAGNYPKAVSHGSEVDSLALGEMLHRLETNVRRLGTSDDSTYGTRAICLKHIDALLDQRLSLVGEAHSTITLPFFGMMLFWLVIVFFSFGMTAPRNAVAAAFIMMVGLSVSGAIFVIIELDGPLDGLIKVSSEPMRHALEHIDLALRNSPGQTPDP